MSVDWPRVKISEVCELIVDCVNKTAPRVEYETPFKMIRTPNIKNGRIDRSGCRFVEKDVYEKWTRRAKVLRNDVLLTREAPMGQVGFVDFDDTVFLGQRIIQYRANTEFLDPKFLLYSFLSCDLQHQFHMHDGSGSVVSHIRVPDCSKFELNLPPLDEQKRISKILGDLDDKIQLNRQTNQTLEQIAQAIFKSWFVDFDPVKAKIAAKQNGQDPELAAICAISGKTEAQLKTLDTATLQQLKTTAALFPDALVESELGEVPEGWGGRQLSSLATNVRKSIRPELISDDDVYVGLEHIDRVSLGLSRWGKGSEVNSNKSGFIEGDVLFGKLRPYFHKVCVAPTHGVCSTDILVVRPKKEIYAALVTMQLFDIQFVEYANVRSTGTRMPRASWKDMAEYQVVLPEDDLIESFNSLVQPLLSSFSVRVNENNVLSEFRDTLLPKLLSGEITPDNTPSKKEAEA